MSLWSLAPVRVTKDGLSGRVAVGAGAVAAHAASDGTLRAIDVRTGEVTAELPKLPAEPRALAVLAGHVVAGLPDGRIAFVSLATKALRYGSRSLQFHTGAAEILDIEPSPDGKQALVLARGAGDEYDQNKGHGVIAMVDVETGKVGVQTVLGEPAYFATFDASGKRVAVVSSHIATVFEVGYPLVEKIRHKDYMFPGKLRFSDDGSFLVTTALAGWSGRIDLGSGAAKRRPDTDPKATSRALGDKVALFDEHRVFIHRASGGEPLTLRSIRVGQTRHGVAYLPGGRFEASADALPHVPVCVGDPPSEQRCGFAPEMGAPVTAGLAAGWLAGK